MKEDHLDIYYHIINDKWYVSANDYKKLKNRIDEAIEYIEKNSDDMHTYISQILTDILKGVDKE